MKASRQTDAAYHQLLDHMNEAVWMGDENERTVYANPKFCEMVEYDLSEIMGWESYKFWEPESAKRVQKANAMDRKKGISSSYEGIIISKTGKKTPVLLSGTPLPDGGTIGIMTNLSELKKKQQEERILNDAISHTTDAVIVATDKGVVTHWNKGAKIIFGYTETEMRKKTLRKIFPEKEFDEILKNYSAQRQVEFQGTHKNGNTVTIAATLSPTVTEAGVADGSLCLVIARDITAQRKFEEELTLKYQKMREAYNHFGVIRRQMDYVFELMDVANGTEDTQAIADFIVTSSVMLTRVDACVLRIYNAKKQSLDLLSCFGVSSDWQGKASINYRDSLTEKAREQGMPLKIVDITREPRYSSKHLARKHGLSSLLCLPLVHRDELIGSLTLYVSPEKKLELFENDFIEKYASVVAMALKTNLV